MKAPLTCREFVEFLCEYAAGDLPANRVALFEQHLSLCPSCVSYMKSYRDSIRLSRETLRADEPLPGDVPEELIQAILAARGR